MVVETVPLDPDLQAELEAARGGFTYEFTARALADKQRQRDILKAMPRDTRRRAMVKKSFDDTLPTAEDLRHIHSVLAICSLPYSRQPLDVRRFERRQGRMSLVLEAGELQSPQGDWVPQLLPYGSRARLLLLHLCSEAIRQNSPTIDIEDSLSAFIRSMGYEVTGGKNGSLSAFKAQVNALAACSMKIGVWNGERARTIRTVPFDNLDVWFPTNADQRILWPSTITFSQPFFDTLKQHALPTNTRAVRVFANSPRKLDLLFWLGYRLKHIHKPLHIGWDALKEQFGQDIGRERRFRTDLAADLAHLKEVFPKLALGLDENGLTILPSSPSVLAIPDLRTRKAS
ncbi:MAG: replication protein RepA [Hyphomicrobiaceae bacterium]